jgi:hypothetical protein
MKITTYNPTNRIDFVMNEWQLNLFNKLETAKSYPIQVESERLVGRTTFIFFYANLLASTRNRNVIIVGEYYDALAKLYRDANNGSFIKSLQLKFIYPNNCTVKFIKSKAYLTGERFENTDVFFDLPNMIFDTTTLTNNSKLILI